MKEYQVTLHPGHGVTGPTHLVTLTDDRTAMNYAEKVSKQHNAKVRIVCDEFCGLMGMVTPPTLPYPVRWRKDAAE